MIIMLSIVGLGLAIAHFMQVRRERMTPAQAAENVALREEIAGLAARLAALEQQVKQNPH